MLSSTYFDTHESESYTNSMVEYINKIPPGIIVAVGVLDEA